MTQTRRRTSRRACAVRTIRYRSRTGKAPGLTTPPHRQGQGRGGGARSRRAVVPVLAAAVR
ncbi:hypothetical protein QJS66_15330 [Kocuria rhizophila]|nr:hypothetical protein QJS66_15330 [Kocuria rhizophila]